MVSTTIMYFDILHVNFMYRYSLLVENSEGPGQFHLLAMGDALASSSIRIMLLGPETSLAAKCRAVRPWHTPDRQHPGPKQTLPPWWAHGNSVRSKDSGRFCQWHPRTRDSAGAAEHSFRHPWGRHSVVRSGLGDKRSCKLNQTSWCLFARAQNETISGFIWLDYALFISLLQTMILF